MWLFGFHIHFMWNFAVQSLSMIIYFFLSKNKDLLTSFAWWKKRTRIHWLDRRIVRKQIDIMANYLHVQNQGKRMMQSRENGQKPQFGHFFDDFEVKYLQIANFSEK